MATSLFRVLRVTLCGVLEASSSPGLGKQVGVSVHRLSLYVRSYAPMCRVWMGRRADHGRSDSVLCQGISKTLGGGGLFSEIQPAVTGLCLP